MKTSNTVRHNLLATLAIHTKPQHLTSSSFEMCTGRGGGGGGGPMLSSTTVSRFTGNGCCAPQAALRRCLLLLGSGRGGGGGGGPMLSSETTSRFTGDGCCAPQPALRRSSRALKAASTSLTCASSLSWRRFLLWALFAAALLFFSAAIFASSAIAAADSGRGGVYGGEYTPFLSRLGFQTVQLGTCQPWHHAMRVTFSRLHGTLVGGDELRPLALFRGHFLPLGGLFSFHGGLCGQHLGIAGAALLYVLFPPTRAGTQFSRAPKRAQIAPCRARRLESRVRERARKGLFTGAKTAPHLTLRLSLLVLAKCRASALLWFPPRKSAA